MARGAEELALTVALAVAAVAVSRVWLWVYRRPL